MKAAAVLSLVGLLGAGPAIATDWSTVPEEDYGFLVVADNHCVPEIGGKRRPELQAECERMTEPRHYHGTWQVEFEGSTFTPAGKPRCIEGVTLDYCPDLVLEGKALPWPSGWACPRRFEVDFVGRRTVWPDLHNTFGYRLVVDRLISAKRLPDPPHEPDECDAAAK